MASGDIIVTGFGPFPGVANNPSAMLADAMVGTVIGRCTVRTHLLDTVYDKARERIAALLDPAPAALILTGYSREASGFVLETRATAACLPDRPDAAGCLPSVPDEACDHGNSAIDAEALAEDLREAGLPAITSRDAGGYLCNHVFWQALDLVSERDLSTQTIFVHIPRVAGMDNPPEGAAAMPLADLVRGLGIVARVLTTALRP